MEEKDELFIAPYKRPLSSHNRPQYNGTNTGYWEIAQQQCIALYLFRGYVALQDIKCYLSRVTLWPHGCWQSINKS